MTAKRIIEEADGRGERGTQSWWAYTDRMVAASWSPAEFQERHKLRLEIRALLEQEGAAKASEAVGGPDAGTLGSCARCGVLWATGVEQAGSLCAPCRSLVRDYVDGAEL